jgi:Flp pilus assembly protein TadG
MIRALKKRRLFRREEGSATIEFVCLFPLFIMLLLMSIEAGIYMIRQVMLDRAVDVAVRELRLGGESPPTFEQFKDRICEEAIVISDCTNVVQVELSPIDTTTWLGITGTPKCRDVTQNIDPLDQTDYSVGSENEIMMVQVCGLFDPFMPTTHLGLRLQYMPGGLYAIVVKSAFVNEPVS